MDSIDTLTLTTEKAGPNWSAVPFEVGCARCGHDLRGQTEPICPNCKLEFDWAVAVPIEQLTCLHCKYHLYGLTETRCPECGESFTWQEVLDHYHRQQKPLFEYRWRRKPFRSLVRTWWSTLRPTKFWSQIDMHDPPCVIPLLSLACLYTAILHALVAISLATGNQIYYWMQQTSYRTSIRLLWFGGTQRTFLQNVFALLDDVYDNLLETQFVIALAAWMISSYLALLIFQQSMRRFKVRNVHLVRVWIYSFPMIPLMTLAITFGFPFAVGRMYVRLPDALPSIILIIAVALVVRSIQVAYKKYLLMPHSWAVAICTQIIALMTGLSAWLIVRWG